MEREFPICITEEPQGKLIVVWDHLYMTVQASLPLRREGLCKLWLVGEQGKVLLGTMMPERGWLRLCRQISLHEAKRAGAWSPVGVESMLIWDLDFRKPFPRTDLFCFAEVQKNRLFIRFDRDGQPVMPKK